MKNSFPVANILTQEVYDQTPQKELTGLFYIPKEGEFLSLYHCDGEDYFHNNSYVFLKNGIPHQEKGPAFFNISSNHFRFCINGKSIKNRPFENQSFKYSDYPKEVICSNPPIWTGTHFEINEKSIIVYEFFDELGNYHNLEGPAEVRIGFGKPPLILYCIDGESLNRDEFDQHPDRQQLLTKECVLRIIRNA